MISCTAEALNGTDLKGKTVLCFLPIQGFQTAMQNVIDAGGSGLIFAQYAANSVDDTADCGGIACVLVDTDTGYKILRYIRTSRYTIQVLDS